MKRFLIFFLLLCLVFGVFSHAYAYYQPKMVEVTIDGKTFTTKEVRVLVNGAPIETEVPSIPYQERTLVPIRFVAEAFGAVVDWDQENYQVTVDMPNKNMILPLNTEEVIINGERQSLPYNVPPKVVSQRVLVPLRFIAEVLGAEVGWDQENFTATLDIPEQEVTDISIDSSSSLPSIAIATTGEVTHKDIFLENPYRLVIDIPNSKMNIADKTLLDTNGLVNIEANTYPIQKIRASQFSLAPNVTRIVIDLDRPVSYNITQFKNDNGLSISFINKVQDIQLETINNRKAIAIYNSNSPQYNIIRLSNPDRIVIDLMDSFLESNQYLYNYETEFIKSVRTSKFTPDNLYSDKDDIVRVVLDLKEMNPKPNLMTEVENGKLILYVDNTSIDGISYQSGTSSHALKIASVDGDDYNIEYNTNSQTMAITIPKADTDLKTGMQSINDAFIDSIYVEERGDSKVVSVVFNKVIDYETTYSDTKDELLISFTEMDESNDVNNKFSDKLIVIDAGHGGYDPGTHGVNSKLKEKDLNLFMAFRLEQKLKEAGFKTMMTRETDEFINLYDRPKVANENDADLFISIHFNAHPDSDIKGIQTLYCPSYESDKKTVDQYPFAYAMHQEVLEALGTKDMGIRRRPELVVTRETAMEAVLVELGFMSNPEEEKQILTTDYQEKAAEGIVNGVIRYLEEKENNNQ